MRRVAVVFLALVGVVAASALVLWLARKTSRPTDAKIAEDLAILCQSLDEPLSGMGYVWLPDSARALGPAMGDVGPNGVYLYSGRESPRYRLTKVSGTPAEAGGLAANWSFTVEKSDADPVELARVNVPYDAMIPMPLFTDRALAAYAHEIEKNRDDRFMHFHRIEFAMRFRDRAAVRALLVDSIKRAPKLSEPRMALAVFDDAGMRELDAWAYAPPTFRKLTELALVHYWLGHTDAAIAATRDAVKLPMHEEKEQNLNASARMLPIAKMALEEKRFDDAIFLASAMQNGRDIDEYSRKRFVLDWRSIRAAAMYRKGDHAGAAALIEPDGLVEPEIFYRSEDDPRPKLAKAIWAKDDAAVDAWKPKPEDGNVDAFLCGAKLLPYVGVKAR